MSKIQNKILNESDLNSFLNPDSQQMNDITDNFNELTSDAIYEYKDLTAVLYFVDDKINQDFLKDALYDISIIHAHSDKDVKMYVISSVDETKKARYEFGDKSFLTYDIVNLNDLNSNKI